MFLSWGCFVQGHRSSTVHNDYLRDRSQCYILSCCSRWKQYNFTCYNQDKSSSDMFELLSWEPGIVGFTSRSSGATSFRRLQNWRSVGELFLPCTSIVCDKCLVICWSFFPYTHSIKLWTLYSNLRSSKIQHSGKTAKSFHRLSFHVAFLAVTCFIAFLRTHQHYILCNLLHNHRYEFGDFSSYFNSNTPCR